MLSLGYTWFQRGRGLAFEVPSRWGSQGRINLIGTLSLRGEHEQLEVRELEGSCKHDEGIAYLDTLSLRCDPARLTVVVLDNASFHKGKRIRERVPIWEARGMLLRYLPPYCPVLNRIETTWRRLKGFLMPRRCYHTLQDLRAALHLALKTLNATFL